MKRLIITIAAGATVMLTLAFAVVELVRYRATRADLAAWETARRVNGDVLVYSRVTPFPDIERVRALAMRLDGVDHVGSFAIWPVQLKTNGTWQPGLLKLAELDKKTAASLHLRRGSLPRPKTAGMVPEITLGDLLAKRLKVAIDDRVSVHVAAAEGTTADTTVSCRVRAIVDWGFATYNEELLYADLSYLSDFSLLLTGIELVLVQPQDRVALANRLQSQLGGDFRALTLEDMMRPTSGSRP